MKNALRSTVVQVAGILTMPLLLYWPWGILWWFLAPLAVAVVYGVIEGIIVWLWGKP